MAARDNHQKRVDRIVHEHKLSPATELLIQQTYEKQQVLFILLKNLSVEIQELRTEQTKLRSAILTLLADPQAQQDAVAVLKDWNIHKNKI